MQNLTTFKKADFNPRRISSLKCWLRADKGVIIDGSNKVFQWQDQSGNGNNFSQNTADLQPVFVLSGINGLPSVFFDGSNDELDATNRIVDSGNPYSVVSIQRTYLNTRRDAYGNSNTTGDAGLFLVLNNAGADDWLFRNDANETSAGAKETNSFFIASIVAGASAQSVFHNGVFAGNSSLTLVTGNNVFKVGAVTPALPFHGELVELLIFNAALSNQDRENVEKYLSKKYRMFGL